MRTYVYICMYIYIHDYLSLYVSMYMYCICSGNLLLRKTIKWGGGFEFSKFSQKGRGSYFSYGVYMSCVFSVFLKKDVNLFNLISRYVTSTSNF